MPKTYKCKIFKANMSRNGNERVEELENYQAAISSIRRDLPINTKIR